MTKKFLISLLFVVAFILLISASDKVSAFTVEYEGKTINFDIELRKYTLVKQLDGSIGCEIWVYTSDTAPYIYNKTQKTLLVTGYGSIAYYYARDNKVYYHSINEDLYSVSTMFNVLYSNFDLCCKDGTLFYPATDKPDKFFNFRHGTLDYSINLTANNNHISFYEYIAIFKANNYLLLYTSKDRPTYKYNNYKHYLHTSSDTFTRLYDLKTDTVIRDTDLTYYYENGADISFDKSQLIYSNFYLYDENMREFFGTTGDYLGDEDMKRHCIRKYCCWWSNF